MGRPPTFVCPRCKEAPSAGGRYCGPCRTAYNQAWKRGEIEARPVLTPEQRKARRRERENARKRSPEYREKRRAAGGWIGPNTTLRSNPSLKKGATPYRITRAERDRMFEAQGGRCAICGQEDQPGDRLCIDHHHQTGQVRALLCRGCNAGLGCFRERPDLLTGAIVYLGVHS